MFVQECLGSGDGIAAGQAVLQFSTKQTCVGEHEQAAFLAEMDSVFKEKCRGYHTASTLIHTDSERAFFSQECLLV